MGLTSSIDIDLSEYPSGIAPEQFVGSLTRDTLGDPPGDFAEEELVGETTLSLSGQPITAQTLFNIIDGWQMIGWPWPYEQDVKDAFTSLLGREPSENDFEIVKDFDGNVYWPQFDFNGIGNFKPLEGYQFKESDSNLTGKPLNFPILSSEANKYRDLGDLKDTMNTTFRDFPEGWSMFSTGRFENMDAVEAFKNMTYIGFPKSRNHPNQLPGHIEIQATKTGTFIACSIPLTTHFNISDQIQFEITAPIPFRDIIPIKKHTRRILSFENEFTASLLTPAVNEGDIISSNSLENVTPLLYRGSQIRYNENGQQIFPTAEFEWSGSSMAKITGTNTRFLSDYTLHGASIDIISIDRIYNLNTLFYWQHPNNDPEDNIFYYAPIIDINSDTELTIQIDNIPTVSDLTDEFTDIPYGTIKYKPQYIDNPAYTTSTIGVAKIIQSPIVQLHGTDTLFLSDFIKGNRIQFLSNVGDSFFNISHVISNIHSDTSMSIDISITLNTAVASADLPSFPSNQHWRSALPESLAGVIYYTPTNTTHEGKAYIHDVFSLVDWNDIEPGDALRLNGPNFFESSLVYVIGRLPVDPNDPSVLDPYKLQVSPVETNGVNAQVSNYSEIVESGNTVTLYQAFNAPDGSSQSAITDLFNTGAGNEIISNVVPGDLIIVNLGETNEFKALAVDVITSGVPVVTITAAPGYNFPEIAIGAIIQGTKWGYAHLTSNISVTSLHKQVFPVLQYKKSSPFTIDKLYTSKATSSAYYETGLVSQQDITDDIHIVKDADGNVYWPEYNFNGIGDLVSGQGYQIKMNATHNQLGFPIHTGDNRPLIDR